MKHFLVLIAGIFAMVHCADASAANSEPGCGLQGKIQERIASCAETDAAHPTWVLVARTGNGNEVWFDKEANLLWSQALGIDEAYPTRYKNFDDAVRICAEPTGANGLAGIMSSWRLPTITEFEATAKINRRIVVGPDSDASWSSTEIDKDQAWAYVRGVSEKQTKKMRLDVRCVASYDAKADANPPASTSTGPQLIPISEVRRIMTKLEWQIANKGWAKSYELDHCDGSKCFLREWLRTDQICPAKAPSSKWCEGISKAGEVEFIPGGLTFTEYGTAGAKRCHLEKMSPKSSEWWLGGLECPLLGLSASDF